MPNSSNIGPGSTLAQLKHDIDSGRTGDKVVATDPGLSPLGTDDEAGGNSPTPAQVSLARSQESRDGAAAGSNSEAPPVLRSKGLTLAIMVAVIVVVVAGALVVLLNRA